MSVKVTYTDKNGKPASMTFGSAHQAQMYAKTVKNPTFSIGVVEAPTVEVTKCGTPAQEEYKRRKAALMSEDTSEQEAEAYMEAGVQALLQGAATSEALDAAAWAASNVRASEFEKEIVCACGNKCSKGLTSCYICRRYA